MIDALLRRQHTAYREIGFLSPEATLARAGIEHTDQEVRELVSTIERLDPFPDAPEALRLLRTRFRLTILSNGDPEMLNRGVDYTGIVFDDVISVATAGSFKPDRVTYATACDRLGVQPEQVLFVANHVFDCVGAKAAGMRTAFVNRRGRPFGRWPYQPDISVGDLRSLAEELLSN